ncbi:hypothetical protein KC622_00635 [Candidatus Dojkabacteria bacterium]|uniref:Uncharacterized protein n=1 Tax=Candidatus Dojkabacteria bacterium TaxID=2099670 RepID=A0A955HXG2_9BACT|nr:hypothetical protein [Candidatus Dojkabacteria bacterium]
MTASKRKLKDSKLSASTKALIESLRKRLKVNQFIVFFLIALLCVSVAIIVSLIWDPVL